MAGPYRERVRLLLAKIETTSGVDAAPVATADTVRTKGIPTIGPGYLNPGLRDDVQTGVLMTTPRAAPAGRFASIDVVIEVGGSATGAPYDATTGRPEADVFLRICGMSRFVGSTGGAELIRYQTVDEGMETATVWAYTAGKLIKLVGCVATMRLSGTANQVGEFAFTVTGRVAAEVGESALPGSIGLSDLKPPLFHSGPASIGTWTSATAGDPLVLKSIEVDLGNVIADRPSAGATDGHAGYLITDRRARQTMVVEVPALATFDAFALSKAIASLPLTAYQFGTAQYNRLKVQTGVWALEMPALGAQSGLMTQSLVGNLTGGAPVTGRELNLLFD